MVVQLQGPHSLAGTPGTQPSQMLTPHHQQEPDVTSYDATASGATKASVEEIEETLSEIFDFYATRPHSTKGFFMILRTGRSALKSQCQLLIS